MCYDFGSYIYDFETNIDFCFLTNFNLIPELWQNICIYRLRPLRLTNIFQTFLIICQRNVLNKS